MFLVMLTVSVGTWAASFTWTSSDGEYTVTASNINAGYYDSDGDGNNDSYTAVGIQVLVVNKAGALAAFVDETNGQLNGVGEDSSLLTLTISGPMNSDDFESMNSSDVASWGRFTNVDLKGVENATISDVCKMNLSQFTEETTLTGNLDGVKYLRLPNGMTSSEDVASMGTMKENGKNSNLLVVGATDNVATNTAISQIAMHSFQSNNVANFSDALLGGYDAIGSNGSTAKTSVKMAGRYGDEDLCKDNKNLFGTVKSFDFTNATFDPYTIESLTLSAYSDGSHPYARGPQGNGVDANDPFADVSVNAKTTMTLTNYKTNALYFIFGYRFEIENIVFPTGNTDIPPRILFNAAKLTEANIPSHYTLIGHEAFSGSGISQVTIGRNIQTIEAGAFSGCTKLEDVKFETGITNQVYGPAVFSNCQKMKHIVFPEGIKTLGAEMFNLSAYVESVRLPESLENIGSGCFMNCHSLTSITIPQNVEKIGVEAFSLTPLRDVYLTCTDPADLPLIWSMGNNFENPDLRSSFGGNAMNNNTSSGMTAAKAATLLWDEAALEYYFENGIAVLHFPKQLADAVRASISSQYGFTSSDGFGLPNRNNGDYAKRADYLDLNVGTSGVGFYTKNGWAQFALMKEYVPNTETVIYTKEYDDVWYTMCYPFDLTDEQLASAFNEGFNIVDFSAVEIRTDADTQKKELVLHFNNVAKTVYKDQDGVIYNDLGKNGTDFHTFELYGDQYTHVNQTTMTSAKMPTYAKNGDVSNGIKYIDGYLAEAGHPYMIHPNLGVSVGGTKVPSHFSGITWIEESERDDLFTRMARTVDLGGAAYRGETAPGSITYVTGDNKFTEDNFNQAAYEGYEGQTYTFKGNWREYKPGTDPKPTVENEGLEAYPTFPTLLDVFEKPTGQIANPNPELVDPATIYTDAFVTLYNSSMQFYDPNNNYALTTSTYGEAISNNKPATIFSSTYWPENGDTKYFIRVDLDFTALSTYFGSSEFTGAQYSALQTLCNNYVSDLAAWNSGSSSPEYQAYLANQAAWNNYNNALNAYLTENPEKTEADFLTLMSANNEANENAISEWEGECAAVDTRNSAKLAAWEATMANNKVLIPKYAYFLARPSNSAYPKYYREMADDSTPRTTGIWNQYTAIVMPNDAALSGIEETTTSSGSVKNYNIAFNEDYEGEFDTTEIKDIVAKAEEKGQKVEYMNIVYSINGEIVGHGSSSLNNLPKGMYIINGKKYLVK